MDGSCENKRWRAHLDALVWKEECNTVAPNLHDAWLAEQFGPDWGGNPLALGVAQQDPNLAYGTDYGRTMQTTDGGASWYGVYSNKVKGANWTSTGLDVTTNYGYLFTRFASALHSHH